ncbi:hypothetical protein A2738_02220 [Candidatus Nomurabacteria bacterium RIFCSPHIGHO2_01_FULL_42_15]|uniref:ATP-grasp domain-containing protein n=1 Tax=Candidatus Nomurabacteria bacterium RIFCSPHIGHO2_01_FULL_42_15 TaxID=1801742 RepID=A0A1F6VF93_9BACT|nr:MAG: hypothetical protein A2738_02220 [Candidatus Nomurabacteria bacterium RIFCSPHIGHO2_01_FULL_42_15]OGI93416.1 MAG: hypothetical protein A3A99_01950 [Candidatus Nomurabacteria bacterium RIFCSPLOWO2_01_FULL_41_18]
MKEPHPKQSSCSYCGDAPINHTFSFFESIFSITLDNQAKRFIKYVPAAIKHFADSVPEFLFRSLVFFKLAKFSDGMEKANTFRSKIIWEEAKRRRIKMEQVILWGRPLDHYRAILPIGGRPKNFYFESIPIPPEFSEMSDNWDDKATLKDEFQKYGIPVPGYCELSPFSLLRFNDAGKIEDIFSKLQKPLIVKPRVGSHGRHTVTNISTLPQLREGINTGRQICSYLVIEEHLVGSVCRATLVGGRLAGFYTGYAPTLIGDGKKTIRELIKEKDKERPSRVEPIRISKELHDHIFRSSFVMDDILPAQASLTLTHRNGRLFGGRTEEMIDSLHPSFVPILEKAAKVTGLPVVGFDCIIPNPKSDQASQKWGIIECNSLPFIDLHYYALEGKPRNIAGMIWDLWN